MIIKKVSFETSIIIACVDSKKFKKYILSRFDKDLYELIISSRVEGEAINLLQKLPFFYNEKIAKDKVRKVICDLKLKRDRFDKIKDNREGNKLISKYEGICHYPDSSIIAHFKRIGIEIAVTGDWNFKKIAEGEGIRTIYLGGAKNYV